MSIFLGDQEFTGAYLGTKQLQFVYLGEDIVWQDNAAPVVSNATFNGVPLAQNSELSILRNTAHTIQFTVNDPEGDAPFTVKLLRNNTQVGDTVENVPQGGTVTLTIPATVYDDADQVGSIDDTWDINTEDSVGSDQDFTFKVTTLDFAAPTTGQSPTGTVTVSSSSQTTSWNAANSTSGKDQTLATTVNGTSVNNSGSQTFTVPCAGSTTATVVSTTTGGGITKTGTTSVTWSNTATQNVGTGCGSYGSCSSCTPPASCSTLLASCTCNGTQTRTCNNEVRRICDNALISGGNFTESRSCVGGTGANSAYVPTPTVTCASNSLLTGQTTTCTIDIGDVGSGVTVNGYNWAAVPVAQATLTNPSSQTVTVTANGAGTIQMQGNVNYNTPRGGTFRQSSIITITIAKAPTTAACVAPSGTLTVSSEGNSAFTSVNTSQTTGFTVGESYQSWSGKTSPFYPATATQVRTLSCSPNSGNVSGTKSTSDAAYNIRYNNTSGNVALGKSTVVGFGGNSNGTVTPGTVVTCTLSTVCNITLASGTDSGWLDSLTVNAPAKTVTCVAPCTIMPFT